MTTECTMTVLNQPSVVSAGPVAMDNSSSAELSNAIKLEDGHNRCRLEDTPSWKDVTAEFTDACSELGLGVLVHDANFGLFEGMSAIEMMDPKMDAGMMCNQTKHKVLSLSEAIKAGRVKVEDLTRQELIGIIDETYACLVTWLEGHSLAQTVFINLYLHDTSLIKDRVLRAFCSCFLKLVDNARDRINRAGVFEEEDFQSLTYGFKMAGDEAEAAVTSAVKGIEDELAKVVKMTRVRTGSERDSATELEHDLCLAVQARLKFTRLFLLTVLSFSKEKLTGIEDCVKYLSQMKEQLETMKKTSHLGIKPSENGVSDSNGCIMGFEPMVNQRLLPPTFPRHTKIRSRQEMLDYLSALVAKLSNITSIVQMGDNVHTVLTFFVEFSSQSPCILSRSLLQACEFWNIATLYIPPGTRMFGSHTMLDALRDTLRAFCAPPALMQKGALYNEAAPKEWTDIFLTQAARPIILMFQTTGHNRARQRDKWARLLEDLALLQDEAERADACIHGVMTKLDANWQYHTFFATWTLYHVLHTMIRYTLAGFELELYLQHEYQYIFWYLSEGLFYWLGNCLQRADSFLVEYDIILSKDKSSKAAKKNKKKKVPSVHQSELTLTQALHHLCGGYYKTMIGLTMDQKIPVPKYDFDCEEYRYNHRFAQFACISSPPPMPYMQYKEMTDVSRYEPAIESSALYTAAGKNFQQCRVYLEDIANQTEEVQTLLKISKTNLVVVNILSKGHKRDTKTPIQFDFSQHKLYPVIKLM